VFVVMVRRMFASATDQPDLYAKLLGAGMAATLGFQVFIIIGGVIGLFPLTGITLPFISYGGSSLVANFLLVALVWAMSSRVCVPKRSGSRSSP
jgi:cell division protein FtsW (lipid II flippase)